MVVRKTNIMELDKWYEHANIVIDNLSVERVQSFQYLGAMFTTNGDGTANINQRLATAVQALITPSHRRRGATTVFGQSRHHRSNTASNVS